MRTEGHRWGGGEWNTRVSENKAQRIKDHGVPRVGEHGVPRSVRTEFKENENTELRRKVSTEFLEDGLHYIGQSEHGIP